MRLRLVIIRLKSRIFNSLDRHGKSQRTFRNCVSNTIHDTNLRKLLFNFNFNLLVFETYIIKE